MLIFCFSSGAFGQAQTQPQDTTETADEMQQQMTGQGDTADAAQENTEDSKKSEKEKKAEEKQQLMDKKGAEYIEKTLNFGTHKERAEAIARIKNIKTEPHLSKVLDMLVKNIKDESDPGVLRKSFQIAADYERKDAVGPISAYISHDNEDVQIAAIYALKDLDARGQSTALKNELKGLDFSENAGLIEALLVTLGDFEDKTLFEFSKQKIKDPKTSDFNRQRLILFLGNSKTTESLDYLKELFTNEDENITVRSYAVSSLSKLGNSSVVPAINEEIDRIDSYDVKKRRRYHTLYMYCIAALVNLGDSNAYPRLEESLKSNSAPVRLKAIEMMADLKDKRSIDILEYKAKYDPNAKVRAAAKRTLKDTFEIDLDNEGEEEEKEEDSETADDPETGTPQEE